MSMSSITRQIRRFHVVVVQWTSKKCTKKRDVRAKLLFLIIKPVVLLSLWLSSLLKLPIEKKTNKQKQIKTYTGL